MQVIDSPIPYMGKKLKLLKHLLPLFPPADNFYDLFTGSGVVYLNAIGRYKNVIVNDRIYLLIELHKKIYSNDKKFFKRAKRLSCKTKHDKEAYLKLRDSFNRKPTVEKFYALVLACNSNMMRFNSKGEFNQTWGKRCYNDSTSKKVTLATKLVRGKSITFYNYDFGYFRDLPSNSFVYLDPPYYNAEAGYNAQWKLEDEKRLKDLLKHYLSSGVHFGVSGVFNNKRKTALVRWLVKEYKRGVLGLETFGNPYKCISTVNHEEFYFYTKHSQKQNRFF